MSLRFNDLAEPGFIDRAYPDTSSFSISREPLDALDHRFQPCVAVGVGALVMADTAGEGGYIG